MDFYAAKKKLQEETELRYANWSVDRKIKMAAGTATELDKLIEKKYPWYKDTYWAIWRFGRDIFKGYTYRKWKSRLRRVKHGYGSQDVWDLDNYLARWLPSALRELKDSHVGYPTRVKDHDGSILYETGWDEETDTYTGLTTEECVNLWTETLERMALGFEAHEILDEYGWMHDTEAEHEMQRFEREGMLLFVNNFSCLWD